MIKKKILSLKVGDKVIVKDHPEWGESLASYGLTNNVMKRRLIGQTLAIRRIESDGILILEGGYYIPPEFCVLEQDSILDLVEDEYNG